MVKGLDTFRKYFEEYKSQYVLIGGAACDIVFESNETSFRATRDLDMVLIVEALTPDAFCAGQRPSMRFPAATLRSKTAAVFFIYSQPFGCITTV